MSFHRPARAALPAALVAALFTLLAPAAFAKQCGGAVACECGDSVVASTTLTSDLGPCTGTGLRVIASGIFVDCAKHVVTGDDSSNAKFGIHLDQVVGSEVRNCRLTGFRRGLRINGGSGNLLSRNRSFLNKYGIDVAGETHDNHIERNLVRDNRDEGIHVGSGSDDNVILRNQIRYNKRENLYLLRSNGNLVQRNYMHHSHSGASLYVKHSSNNRFVRNDVRDSAIGVVGDAHDNEFQSNYLKNSGYLFTAYCTRADGTTCPAGAQPPGEVWTWTHPHGNTMSDDCIRKTHECYRFIGAYENAADGARLDGTHPCEDVVINQELGGQEATDNAVELSAETCNSDQF